MARHDDSGGGCGGRFVLLLLVAVGCGVAGWYLRDWLPSPAPQVGVVHVEPRPAPGPKHIGSNVSQPPATQPAFDASACDDIADGGPVAGPDCVTARIGCGDTVIGHTLGGVDRFDTRYYESKFCWPATIDHDGGDERVYQLVMPEGDWRAWVDLHSPCADLDVAAVRFDRDPDHCPDPAELINQCEMRPWEGTRSERIELTSRSTNGHTPIWYVVVEGRDDEEGAFSLHVQCAPGLAGPLK